MGSNLTADFLNNCTQKYLIETTGVQNDSPITTRCNCKTAKKIKIHKKARLTTATRLRIQKFNDKK